MDFFETSAATQWLRFLGSTPDTAVFFTDPHGVIQAWYGASERVTGYSAAEATGQTLSMLFPPEDLARGLDVHELAVVHALGVAECDRWNLRKDGSRYWASGVLTAIRDDEGTVVALCKVMRDKTDVRSQLQTLENKVAAREAELERLRQLIAATAHELRNPLMPIVSAIALLKHPEAAHLGGRAIKSLENQVAVLGTLVDDLTQSARAESAGAELRRERLDLVEALRGVIDGLLDTAAARQLQLSLVVPPAPIFIEADPVRLQQILQNLLNNALKYTGPGGHVGVSATTEAHMAVVRIEDDGIGISAEVLPHIFDLFTREQRGPDVAGDGVGLSVVKDLVALHGGQIDARSPGPDKGSVFSLRLPARD